MHNKYYEFHFAEVMGAEVINVGILFYQTEHSFSIEDLKSFTRNYLNKPEADIRISHVSKLHKEDYEKLAYKKKDK